MGLERRADLRLDPLPLGSMPTVRANGIDLCYDVHGHGQPMLMVMGINTQLIHWPPELIERLTDAGFQLIVFDNRDMGQSTWFDGEQAPTMRTLVSRRLVGAPIPTPYTLDDMARDGFGLLTALGIDRAHVVGVSMGGMIAQHMAILEPARVRSLTSIMAHVGARMHYIVDPRSLYALLGSTPTTPDEAGDRVVKLMKAIGSPEFLRPDEEYHLLGATAFRRGVNPEGFRRQLAAIVASGNRTNALRKLTVPCAVIHGTADPLVPVMGGRHTAAAIPGAELVLIEGMGHDLPVPKMPQIVDAIRRVAGSP